MLIPFESQDLMMMFIAGRAAKEKKYYLPVYELLDLLARLLE